MAEWNGSHSLGAAPQMSMKKGSHVQSYSADILMFSILQFGHLLGMNMDLVLLVKNCRNCA